MRSKKQNIIISYGYLNDKLLVIVHPDNQEPLRLNFKDENLYGKICIRNSTVDIVSVLLEDFFLDTRKYFDRGLFSLRARTEKIYGIEIDPLKFQARPHIVSPLQEMYSGLIKATFTEQIGYVVGGQGCLSHLGAYLSYGFEQKAQELAKSLS